MEHTEVGFEVVPNAPFHSGGDMEHTEVGFEVVYAKDFFYTEYYQTYEDLDLFLQGVPIFEDFDSKKDKELLKAYVGKFKTDKGIKFPRHRVVAIAKKMKSPIRQKDNFGCSISCLAFITDKTYEEVVNDLGKEKAETKGFYCKEIVNYLKKLGYQAEFHYLKPKWRKKIYQNKTIVFIKRSKKYPYGHYLVRYQNFWMDSWVNFLKDRDIKNTEAGFRKKLPDRAIYGIFIKK